MILPWKIKMFVEILKQCRRDTFFCVRDEKLYLNPWKWKLSCWPLYATLTRVVNLMFFKICPNFKRGNVSCPFQFYRDHFSFIFFGVQREQILSLFFCERQDEIKYFCWRQVFLLLYRWWVPAFCPRKKSFSF